MQTFTTTKYIHMFLRFTYLSFQRENAAKAKEIYMTEVAPVIRKQKGNKQVLLLEPAEGSDEFISFSLWEAESDIKAFEAGVEFRNIMIGGLLHLCRDR